jgi:hypothetical protein
LKYGVSNVHPMSKIEVWCIKCTPNVKDWSMVYQMYTQCQRLKYGVSNVHPMSKIEVWCIKCTPNVKDWSMVYQMYTQCQRLKTDTMFEERDFNK